MNSHKNVSRVILFSLLAISFVLAGATQAREVDIIKSNAKKCTRENVSLTINYNAREKSIGGAKEKFHQKMQEAEKLAKEGGVKKIELRNENFNIYSQRNNSYQEDGSEEMTYQINGSANYRISPA